MTNTLNSYKQKIENFFGNLSDYIYENPIKIIIIIASIVVILGTQLKYITINTSTEGFLHKNSQELIKYNEFVAQFGKDDRVIIIIQSDNVLSKEFLKKLQKLHKELQDNTPYLNDITSLINARNTYGTKDSLIVDDLFKEIPKNKKEFEHKKKLAHSNPFLDNLIINKDSTLTSIIIEPFAYSTLNQNQNRQANANSDSDESGFDDGLIDDRDNANTNEQKDDRVLLTDEENTKMVNKIMQIVSQYNAEDFKILVAGSSVVTSDIKAGMKHDMMLFTRLTILVIAITLAFLFFRISGVILPLIAVGLTIVVTISLMGLTNTPLSMVTQIMPSFLLAVIVGGAIHILAIFFKEFDITKDKKASLRYAMSHSALAIIMTTLTTAAGLWSFSFSSVAPIADLGKFASAGVILGLLFTIIMIPAVLALIRLKPKDLKAYNDDKAHTLADKILLNIADFSVKYYKQIIVVSFVMIAIAVAIASNLRFSHNPVLWLDEKSQVRISTTLIDKKMGGSSTLEMIIDTKKENGLYEPKILKAIDEFSKKALLINNQHYRVTKVMSIVDILKESNKALHANDEQYYKIPDDKKLIAQELFLFSNSGSDDMETFVDSGFSKARITLKLPNMDAVYYNDLLGEVNKVINLTFDGLLVDNGANAQIYTTGISKLLSTIMSNAIYSSANSYVLAFVLITIMMIFIVGNVKLGLISMIPNVLPILVMSVIMVIFNLPLDMFTMLIGAIAIGLAVDDTVHFLHNFSKYNHKYKDVQKAIEMTLMTTGRAMFVTTIVLSCGFFIFMLASMSNLFNFGLLTGVAIIVALLADFLLLPAIMVALDKKSKK